MSNIRVMTTPFTNRIIAGKLLKDGRTFAANRTDITDEAVGAVAVHLLIADETFECVIDGKTYHLKMTEVNNGTN